MGKIVQLLSHNNMLYALTEDGKIWRHMLFDNGWEWRPVSFNAD